MFGYTPAKPRITVSLYGFALTLLPVVRHRYPAPFKRTGLFYCSRRGIKFRTLPALLLILYVPKVGDYRKVVGMGHTMIC